MKKFNIGELEVTELYDKILVFHNVLSDPLSLIDYYNEHEKEWIPWYTFGDMQPSRRMPGGTWENLPTDSEWEQEVTQGFPGSEYGQIMPNDPYIVEVGKAWIKASRAYFEYTNIYLPSYHTSSWALARYFPDVEPNTPTRTMNYHTDYQQDSIDTPGPQPRITGVLYPNDDYEGGEIGFRVFDSSDMFDVKAFKDTLYDKVYKPKAGDLVMFPSEHPYYHGVFNIYKSPKYIYRLYWTVHQDASPLYEELKEKYGEEEFERLEKERKKRSDVMYRDGWSQSIRIPFAEYYEKLAKGTLPMEDPVEPRESDLYRTKIDDGYNKND